MGGSGTADFSLNAPTASVSALGVAAASAGVAELGTGAYTVEVRDKDGKLQFRLKDQDGNAVAIADRNKTDNSLTSSWQDIPAGDTYDTKCGLTITFGAAPEAGTTSLSYTAAGVAVDVVGTDTLVKIANKINKALQPSGHNLTATVVGTQLVLSAANTGTNHTMIYSTADGLDLGVFSTLQSADNASFTVNNIAFTRQGNTSLTDVINGVTLNLAADAEGKSARLTVNEDVSSARSTIDAFVKSFNDTVKYISDNSAITKDDTGNYTRGDLANDYIFGELRGDLLARFMDSYATTGSFKSLRDIGLSIGDDLTVTVSDADKLADALENDLSGVSELLDTAMGSMNTLLGRFTGSSSQTGYLDSAMKSLKNQVSDLDYSMKDLDSRLNDREQSLYDQYSELQAQLLSLTYMQQSWQSIYGSVSRMF